MSHASSSSLSLSLICMPRLNSPPLHLFCHLLIYQQLITKQVPWSRNKPILTMGHDDKHEKHIDVAHIATVYALNGGTTMQFTLVTRNPNQRVAIHYDHLVVFLSYNNQAISPPLTLPPLHHETKTTVAMSPMLPIPPEFVNGLGNHGGFDAVSLRVVLTGKLKYKSGIGSSHKRVYVGCDVFVGLKRGSLGEAPLLGPSVCKVDT
nr:NDR1/HIN1-like protein 12 [Tanacetum cinerariifolium]